jgi:hypothetical protein
MMGRLLPFSWDTGARKRNERRYVKRNVRKLAVVTPSADADPSAQHKPGMCTKTYRQPRCPARRRLRVPNPSRGLPSAVRASTGLQIGADIGIATKWGMWELMRREHDDKGAEKKQLCPCYVTYVRCIWEHE